MSTPTPRARNSGFTLVEVAIALAIFVFGALAIVQIFPPALGVIRNNESRIAGTQLSETLLARTAAKPVSLPDAVYESNATGNWLTTSDIAMAVVGTPSKNGSLPASPLPTDFDNSALGHFKFISGERHVVLGAVGTTYVLLNFPVEAAATPTTPPVFIDMEEEVQGVQIGADGKLDFSYATDSSGQPFTNPALPGNPPSNKDQNDGVVYYVSYKWHESNGPINGVIDEPLTTPELTWTGGDGKVARSLTTPAASIVPGAVKVRYRQRLGSITPTADQASRGYLDLSGFTPALTTGKTYAFSYLAADWRWMVDDRNAASSTGVVQLPVKNLDDQPVAGLASVLGLEMTIGGASAPQPQALTLSRDNYKNGTVPYAVSAVPGVRYRTVYRALDGWAQQLSVAAKSYVPFYADSEFPSSRDATKLPREQWREYYWDKNEPGYLYFHPSEAGKSVVVSFEYDPSSAANDEKVITNVVMTIDDDIETKAITGFGTQIAKTEFTDIDGTRIIGKPGTPSSYPYVTGILSVQGLSVHARTAWQNADRYTQVIVPAYRALMQ